MRSGQVEPTYAEFDFARFLYIHDVDFRFVIPSGVKGKDYDFGITYADGRDTCADASISVPDQNAPLLIDCGIDEVEQVAIITARGPTQAN